MRQGNYDEASSEFKNALTLEPKFAEAEKNLAEVQQKLALKTH
jgi:Tfp pilus assembly protein PilF